MGWYLTVGIVFGLFKTVDFIISALLSEGILCDDDCGEYWQNYFSDFHNNIRTWRGYLAVVLGVIFYTLLWPIALITAGIYTYIGAKSN